MNIKKILAVLLCLALSFAAVCAIPVSAEVVSAANTLIFDADHWDSSSLNFDPNPNDNSIVMGHSDDYVDAHYSAIDAGAVELVESEDGNYVTFSTRNGYDPDMTYRYNAYGSDIVANTAGAEYVYMTVKFDEANLALFQNSKSFSKNVIGDAANSYNASIALVVALGPDSGVTFDTWKAALDDVNPDEWTTLKLAVTNGEGAVPDATMKNFQFIFGAQLSATMSIKNIRVGSAVSFFGTSGANIAVAPNAGLRFISTIDTYDIIPEGGELVSYGTLLTYYDAVKYGEGDFERNSTIVYNDKDYAVADIIPADEDAVINDGVISINTVIANIPADLYTTKFAVRAYVVYNLGSREMIAYGDTTAKSVYGAASAAVAKQAESEELTAAFAEIVENTASEEKGAINVELTAGSDYIMTSGGNWDAQLVAATKNTNVTQFIHYLILDLTCPDIETILNSYSAGSKASINGLAAGAMDYNAGTALGLYFTGTNVDNIGVTQNDLVKALQANQVDLAAGKICKLVLPISNYFKSDSVVTGIKIMTAHSNAAANLAGVAISLDDVMFAEGAPLEVTLTNGSDYAFTASQWDPQLAIATEAVCPNNFHRYISMDFACADVDTLISNITSGSRLELGGTALATYDMAKAFAIYFTGTSIGDAGVVKNEFKDVLTANRDALANGETVRLKFRIAGDLSTISQITAIQLMPAHGGNADIIGGMNITVDNIAFEGAAKEPVAINLTNGSDYAFANSAWYPQLDVATDDTVVGDVVYEYLYMDIACSDIETVASLITVSSRVAADTGAWTDGDGTPLKIYFGGANVDRIGVSYNEFVNVINANKEAMLNGNTVTLKFKVTNCSLFKWNSSITTISFMPTHGDANAAAITGIEWDISNVRIDVE